MKYLKKFETHEEYLAFLQSSDYTKPNVSFCVLQEEVHYGKFIPNPHITIVVNETSTPSDGTAYDIGEYITYRLTITNDGDVDLTNIVITCGINASTIQTLDIGDTETISDIASIAVTESDILGGSIPFSVQSQSEYMVDTVVDFQDSGGDSHGEHYAFNVAGPNPSLTITAETTSYFYNYDGYVPGETIRYTITAENTGNLTLTNVMLGSIQVESILPGATVEYPNQSYVVTSADEVNEEAVIEIHSSASNQSDVQTYIDESDISISEPVMHDYSKDYFTIESLEDGNVIRLSSTNTNPANYGSTIYYSTDGGITWQQGASSEVQSQGLKITLNTNEKVLFKSLESINQRHYDAFYGSKTYKCYGNIMSLPYGDDFSTKTTVSENGQFRYLFNGQSNLTDVHNLVIPVASVPTNCFYRTFYACTSIEMTPVIPDSTRPSSTISNSANVYKEMFSGCSNLAYVKCFISNYEGIVNLDFGDWFKNTPSDVTFMKPSSVSFDGWTQWTPPSTWTVVNIEDT